MEDLGRLFDGHEVERLTVDRCCWWLNKHRLLQFSRDTMIHLNQTWSLENRFYRFRGRLIWHLTVWRLLRAAFRWVWDLRFLLLFNFKFGVWLMLSQLLCIFNLLLHQNFAHLLDRYGGLDIDPLTLYHVLVAHFEYPIDTANVCKSHKAESSGSLSALVL